MRMKWRQKYLFAMKIGVPKKPGLYAYGTVKTVHDLEKSRSIVYVGKAKNLHQRINQHLPRVEGNPRLREYLRTEKDIICWYCPLDIPSKEISQLEREMIKDLAPKFNTQHKPIDKGKVK